MPNTGCDCAGNNGEFSGEAGSERLGQLTPMDHDPREGLYDEFRCPECGEHWIMDFPWHHWAADKRGRGILRRWETLLTGRPLNALPADPEPG